MQFRKVGRRLVAVSIASALLGCAPTKDEATTNPLDEIIVGKVECDISSVETSKAPTVQLRQLDAAWLITVNGRINLESTYDNGKNGLLVLQERTPTTYRVGPTVGFDRDIFLAQNKSLDSVRVNISIDKTSRKVRITANGPDEHFTSAHMNPGFVGTIGASGGNGSRSTLKVNNELTQESIEQDEVSAVETILLPSEKNGIAQSQTVVNGKPEATCTASALAIKARDGSNVGVYPREKLTK